MDESTTIHKDTQSGTDVKLLAKKKRIRNLRENRELLIMTLPTVLHIFLFCYIPMFGIILAFKKYRVDLGILGSKWCGFDNFKFFFTSQDALRVIRNTLGLNLIFIFGGLICSVALALLLFEINKRFFVKIYQTLMILPNYVSWVIVGYMAYAFLNPDQGLANTIMKLFGLGQVQWYSEAKYWPVILFITYLWKGVGLNCVIYYAALMGVNDEYYEAAAIDGAGKFQMTLHISIPFLIPIMTILTTLALGGIFRSDFGMFFNLTRDIGALYSTTDVIDTYIYRVLRSVGDTGMSAAIGLFQSAVGCALILITNAIVRKIESDNALF